MRRIYGFTLIELMVAVLIIGILVTIAVPNYARSVERAKCAQAVNNLKTMRSAALDFFADINNQTFVGADTVTLAARVGADFSDNADWTYSTAEALDTWTVTATRLRGHWFELGQRTITLNHNEVWGGTYPRNDPGNF